MIAGWVPSVVALIHQVTGIALSEEDAIIVAWGSDSDLGSEFNQSFNRGGNMLHFGRGRNFLERGVLLAVHHKV